jgi:hypothetical protein
MQSNDSTRPAMNQSGQEPCSLVQVQSKKFLDRDGTNPKSFGTLTELPWPALDQSTRGRIGPSTLGVTDTPSQQIDSYTYTHTCRLILPFRSHNVNHTPYQLPLATHPGRNFPTSKAAGSPSPPDHISPWKTAPKPLPAGIGQLSSLLPFPPSCRAPAASICTGCSDQGDAPVFEAPVGVYPHFRW